ncbi:MAG: methionine biosynthesis protein MetW, partial [Chloroflexi bacterium]|nr:methionine biosynthesis protein MetW [Chloroflexota bacterium]
LLLTGRIPQAPDLPKSWWEAPRWQALTITDFANFTRQHDIRITRQVYLTNSRVSPIRKFKNLMATTAVFQLEL